MIKNLDILAFLLELLIFMILKFDSGDEICEIVSATIHGTSRRFVKKKSQKLAVKVIPRLSTGICNSIWNKHYNAIALNLF